jgi:hypothetical protein
MSDILCVKCGEPWDAYELDMLPWEADLFRKGAGCPSCEGISNGWQPTRMSDIDNGDEDPMQRLVAHEKGPDWKRPENSVHWTCDGCGVEVVTDVDSGELEYHVPYGAECRQWYHSHPFTSRYASPEKTPAHTFGNGVKVCEFCLDHCADCGTPITSNVQFGDTYDEGNSFLQPGSCTHSVCIDCLEQYCDDCASRFEDCTCD